MLKDDHPYCTRCYESVFANTCDDCNQVIGIDSKVCGGLCGVCGGLCGVCGVCGECGMGVCGV